MYPANKKQTDRQTDIQA